MKNHKNCEQIQNYILNGELNDELSSHLKSCSKCADFNRICKVSATAVNETPGPDFNRIFARRKSNGEFKRFLKVAASAVLVLAMVGAFWHYSTIELAETAARETTTTAEEPQSLWVLSWDDADIAEAMSQEKVVFDDTSFSLSWAIN